MTHIFHVTKELCVLFSE